MKERRRRISAEACFLKAMTVSGRGRSLGARATVSLRWWHSQGRQESGGGPPDVAEIIWFMRGRYGDLQEAIGDAGALDELRGLSHLAQSYWSG